ncbi:MAG: sigma-70 family RNA polymerase sigma factor [Endomicrobiia bacterium]
MNELELTEKYLDNKIKTKPLSNEEFKNIFRIYKKTKNERIKQTLIESNLKLVFHIAKNFKKRLPETIEFNDLVEEGILGLMVAIDRYKISKNTTFSTYATRWIQNYIQKYIKEKSSSIELPGYVVTLIKKWLFEWQNIYKKYGRNPTIKEMQQKLDISFRSAKKILDILNTSTKISSLDTTVDEDGEITVGDTISDNEINPEEFISALSTRQMLDSALNTLTDRERTVIKLKYGLWKKQKKLSCRKIAKVLHISTERVSQIEKNSLNKLKKFVFTKM